MLALLAALCPSSIHVQALSHLPHYRSLGSQASGTHEGVDQGLPPTLTQPRPTLGLTKFALPGSGRSV